VGYALVHLRRLADDQFVIRLADLRRDSRHVNCADEPSTQFVGAGDFSMAVNLEIVECR
jgi:hypothetical protein